MTQSNDIRWVRLGDYITQRREKNNNYDVPILGVTRDGFIPPKQEGADTSLYNVFYKYDFVFNPARMELNSIYINLEYEKAICSSLYEIFYVSKPEELLPEFLSLFIKRDEFARFCWYDAIGSARNYFRVSNMQDMLIPLPSINTQQKLVDTYKGVKFLAKQNEAMAAPLMQLCQSRLQELKHKYPLTEIGPYIELCDERNSDDKYGEEVLRGVTSSGEFDKSKANTEGLKFTNYKVVRKGDFAYNPSRINIGSIALHNEGICIISPMYIVFRLNDAAKGVISEDFLNLWFKRSEFQRSTLFYATGSVRDTFSFIEMERVRIPIPSIKEQQAIVNIYKCATECKRIAEEADKLSREICPALMQKAIRE